MWPMHRWADLSNYESKITRYDIEVFYPLSTKGMKLTTVITLSSSQSREMGADFLHTETKEGDIWGFVLVPILEALQ